MSFSLGPIRIDDPVFLAPMTGVTDLPFRRLVKKYGAGLVFSEMIASRPMIEQARRTPAHTKNYAEEFPMAVQIAGCEPDIMAEAARINVDRGATIIDINFGCPVKKIINNFAGSALMKNETLAAEIMEAVVKAVSVPVTVKMRLGWDDNSINAPRMAKTAENIGVQMITVHGRTRCQLYNGSANWRAVRDVKNAIKIPVIVNGDILSAQNAKDAIEQSGADGIMIGRGAYGKPWLVSQIMAYFKNTPIPDKPDAAELFSLILEHYDSIIDYYGAHTGVGIARKHIGWYCKDLPASDELRGVINRLDNPEDVKQKLKDYFFFHNLN